MCGIVGYLGNKDSKDIILDGLKKLEYRGYDSAGVSFFTEDNLSIIKSKGKISILEEKISSINSFGSIGIGHTRWATHGKPSDINAHPHSTKLVSVVHNGIIENYMDLKQDIIKANIEIETETDTEIIAKLIHMKINDGLKPLQAINNAIKMLKGSFAIACIFKGEKDKIFFAKANSPLVIGLGKNENILASDIQAAVKLTNDFIFLEDGRLGYITRASVEVYDFELKKVEPSVKRIDFNPISIEKMGYKHFMQKEIFEQTRAIFETMAGRIELADNTIMFDDKNVFNSLVEDIDKITIIACGTSYHAGLVGKFIFENLALIPTDVDLASEFRYRNPIVNDKTLIIAISQSGETADTIAAIKEAKLKGAKVLAICNVQESTITRISHYTIYTHAGPEIGVASTKAFTTQLTVLYLMGFKLQSLKNPEQSKNMLSAFLEIPNKLGEIFKQDKEIYNIAQEFFTKADFLYLGRGVNYPIALEGALKLKEISYIHAEGYPAGEMKHGPIALIDESMPVVVISPKGASFEKILSNIEEVKARGGIIIAITSVENDILEKYSDYIIKIPEIDEFLSPLLTVVPLQMLAYHIAVLKGTDVDQPRNLAKSVTVE
ncbi:MAG: glutamine--fructose-6-phosphate transaminase (isomerizing) [Pseudomonadota bacterium]